MIAIDDLRWDTTSLADPERDLTPSLAELADQRGAITFTNACTPAPSSLEAYASVFTSRDMLKHRVGLERSSIDASTPTLASVLSFYGYQTAAFTGGLGLDRATGEASGFDVYEDEPTQGALDIHLDDAESWLAAARSNGRPWFLLVHGYDAHTPYRSPDLYSELADRQYQGHVHDYPGLFTSMNLMNLDAQGRAASALDERDLDHIGSHYASAVRTADHSLGDLLVRLERLGALDGAWIFAFADHGEQIREQGNFHHGPQLDGAVLHVPLVVKAPHAWRGPREDDGVVSLLDMMPTILSIAHATPPAGIDGHDLFGERLGWARAASVADYAVKTDDWLLVRGAAPGRPPQPRLLAGWDGEDVSAQHPKVVEELLSHLADWPAELPPHAGLQRTAPPQFVGRMQQAGYWTAPEDGQ